jgi:hypothetical protein
MLMNDVIDQIAIEAEQDSYRFKSVLRLYGGPHGFNLLRSEADLSLEQINELNQEILGRAELPSPRLSIAEINSILSDYPCKLPSEFYELYQRGNGVLPIGVGEKDWNCYDNYFLFPFLQTEIDWLPLHRSMEVYKTFRGYKLEPNIFPLMGFERWVWAIAGNETQQPTSPVFRFHSNDISCNRFRVRIVWNSLTEMIANRCSEAFSDISESGLPL